MSGAISLAWWRAVSVLFGIWVNQLQQIMNKLQRHLQLKGEKKMKIELWSSKTCMHIRTNENTQTGTHEVKKKGGEERGQTHKWKQDIFTPSISQKLKTNKKIEGFKFVLCPRKKKIFPHRDKQPCSLRTKSQQSCCEYYNISKLEATIARHQSQMRCAP